MAILSLASFLAKDEYRNGRKGALHVALPLSLLLARGCAEEVYETTTQDPQTPQTAHISEGGESAVYIWITSFAFLNTFFLLVVLLYTVYNVYSMKMQEGMDVEKEGSEVKTKLRKFIDGLSAFKYSSFHSRHNNQSSKGVEDNCQVNTDPSPDPDLRISIEKRNRSPKPALPSSCPPPCPRSRRESLHDSQPCPNSNLKTLSEKRKDLLPPIPPNCNPQPSPERSGSRVTQSSESEEHEYDYIELPIRPTPIQKQDHEDSKNEEINEKKKENDKLGTNESDEDDDYDYIDWPTMHALATQKKHETADKSTQTNENEETTHQPGLWKKPSK